MFLKRMRQPNGRVKLTIYESYREGKRTRQRSVKALGYLDELEKEHDDPVLWGKSLTLKMTQEKESLRASLHHRDPPSAKDRQACRQ